MEEKSEEEIFEVCNGAESSLAGLPASELHEYYEVDENEVKRKKRLGAYWKRPATKVYFDNFGFGVNGYQPMIDYLDIKDAGGNCDKSEVHLPSLLERCMTKYSSQKPFRFYENCDIDKLITKGEKIRTQIRQNDAAGASNVHRRTHTNWSMTKKYVQLVKKSYVVDYRKSHPNKEERETSVPRYYTPPITSVLPKYTLAALLPKFLEMASANLLSSYVREKLNHENDMAVRREKLRRLDNEYEETLHKLAFNVDRMSQRIEPSPVIISTGGRLYRQQDMIDVVDDQVESNRRRRHQEMCQMSNDVDALTDSTIPRRQRFNPHLTAGDNYAINPTVLAIARRNAQAAVLARHRVDHGQLPGNEDDYEFDGIDKLRRKYLGRPNNDTEPHDCETRIRPKKIYDDVPSDVQTRILNRAREMGGVSAESRRINNRARFVNTVSPRPDTGSIDLIVPPSKVERNILNMAKSLAYTSSPIRQYDIDDEMDPPVSNLNTNLTKAYCTREFDKPITSVPSDSEYVRTATRNAKIRNTLLGN